MNYTIKQFKKQFPNDNTCLDYLFNMRYGSPVCPVCGKSAFYRVKGRKCYACACGYQIHPVAGTIFHKSDTSLTNWFFAVYLMSQSKNGVSAKEIQRYLGTTYKTAWRIGKQIRSLMKQDSEQLGGVVEIDEAFIGGKRRLARKNDNKTPVVGVIQRGGKIKAKATKDIETHTLLKMLRDNVKFGSRVISDDTNTYKPDKILRLGMFHDKISHSKEKYVRGDIHTNTIEGFWSQLKRSIDGTYHSLSIKHLQSYVDEASFHYNQRLSSASAFEVLLSRLCEQPDLGGQRMPVFPLKVSS